MAKTPTPPRRPGSSFVSRSGSGSGSGSKSATVQAAHAAPSKRQRSRWDREQRHQRLLYLGIGLIALLVVGVLIAGWVIDNLVRPRDVVATVAGDTITAGQLVDALRPEAGAVDTQARLAGAGASSTLVDQQKRQLPDQALTSLVQQRIIQQEADRRGITVPPDEVERRVQQTVAQVDAAARPTSEPTPADSPTPVAASDPGATPTPLPILQPPAYAAALQKLLGQYSLTEAQFRERIGQDALYQAVQAAVGAELAPENQEQVHARHLLVPTQEAAQSVLQQLQDGADFAQLAATTSTDPGSKDKGGDLGWFPRGVMVKEFEDAAFALQPGQLSDVVKSANGYHVIQVLERDPSRLVAAIQLSRLRQQTFNTWLEAKRTGADVVSQLSAADRDWALSRVRVRP